jgi:hypothetical protein
MAPRMTRRHAIGAVAAGSALLADTNEPNVDPVIVKRHDDSVESTLSRQITDPGSRGYGTLPDGSGLYSAHAAGRPAGIVHGGLPVPQSKFHGSKLLLDRMRLAAGYMNRTQHDNGFIDLLSTNFSSPPDTGFAVHNAATAACLAKRHNQPEIVALMEPFLRKAAAGMATGGIHTANHRWVVCSALAQVNEIFPNPAYVRRIDEWLAEGIDLDGDGQFTERSTSVYNAICDRAFVVLAAKLNRPELLGAARRNLTSMVSAASGVRGGDRNLPPPGPRRARDMGAYWFPLQYLAVHDRNPHFAAIAGHFVQRNGRLSAYMEYPELAAGAPQSAPPDDYEMDFPVLDIVRFRRHERSATIFNNDSRFFSLRQGQAVIAGVRMASAFFGKGQFIPVNMERGDRVYRLTQELEGVYYQPLAHAVAPKDWGRARQERKRSEICRLRQAASIAEMPRGFRIRMEAQGTPNVPVAIEIGVRNGAQVEGCIPATGHTDSLLLASGFATISAGEDRMRFGPGLGQHRYIQVRGADSKLPGTSIYLTAFTPLDHTIEFVCE